MIANSRQDKEEGANETMFDFLDTYIGTSNTDAYALLNSKIHVANTEVNLNYVKDRDGAGTTKAKKHPIRHRGAAKKRMLKHIRKGVSLTQ